MIKKFGSLLLMLTFLTTAFQFSIPLQVEAAAVTMTANYNATSGTCEPDKILNGSQGGHDILKNTNWMTNLLPQFNEMGMRIVRISHLLNDFLYAPVSRPGGPGTPLQFNWSRLDAAILPIVQNGMIPFMNVSFTPVALGGSADLGREVPNNWTEWSQCVTALVQHYKELGYTGWYWEVWNEPDWGFFYGSTSEYITLYVTTVNAIRAIDPTAKVGGSGEAHATGAYLDALINHVRYNPSVPLDFVSYHEYGDTTWDQVDTVQAKLNNAGLGSKAIFVTEWGYGQTMGTPYGPNETNVETPQYARKLYLATQKSNLAKIFVFQPLDGAYPSMTMAGFHGTVTARGHRKSISNAFKMFNNMQPAILSATYSGLPDGNKNVYGFVTKDAASKKVAVMLWNNSPTNSTMTVTINNLPYAADGKNFKVTKYLVDRNNANYAADPMYLGMSGYKVSPMETLDNKESSITASSSTFTRSNIDLPPYSVVQFILEPTSSSPAAGPVDPDTAIPTPNLAARKTVSSSSSTEVYGWGRSKLTDELVHTITGTTDDSCGWLSSGYGDPAHTEWVTVNLGYLRSINQVKLYPRDDWGNMGKCFPVDFTIQGYNGSSWVTLVTKTNYNNGNPVTGAQTFSFTTGNYSQIRLNATKLGYSGYNYSVALAELEVYNTSTAPDPVNNIFYKLLNRSSRHLLHLSGDIYNGISGVYKVPMVSAAFNQNNQKWQTCDVGGGYWKILSVENPSVCLQLTNDIYNGQSGVYHVVASPVSWNSDYQQWQIISAGGVYYKIRNKANPNVVLMTTGDTYGGVYDVQYTVASPESWNDRAQYWILAQQ